MHNVAVRALLSGGDAVTGGSGGLSSLFDVGMQFVDFAFDVFDIILAHPVLSIFIAVGVLSLAIGLVGKFAGASKSMA